MNKFVILTSQRSGSTWLTDTLNNHPNVQTSGEIFLLNRADKKVTYGHKFQRFSYFQRKTDLARPFSIFKYLKEFENNGTAKAVGFKLMYSQLKFLPEIIIWMLIKKYKVIRLTRKNHLEKIISAKLRSKTNIAHLTDNDNIDQGAQIYLDPEWTLKKVKYKETQEQRMDLLCKVLLNNSLKVTYQNLCNSHNKTMDNIANFLNISSLEKWKSDHKKINKKDKKERIQNYKEIKKIMKENGFSNLL